MTVLDEVTGNKSRSGAILSVIRDGAATYQEAAAACAKFGDTFDTLSPDEYAAAIKMIDPTEVEFEAVPLPNALTDYVRENAPPVEIPPPHEVTEQFRDPDTGITHAAAGPEQPMTADEAQAHLDALKDALHVARQERMRLEAEVRACRGAMASAIEAWNGIGGGYSGPGGRERLVRDHIASEQQRKQDIKDGKLPPRGRQVANSYFDQVGAFGRGNANSFVRKGHVDIATGVYHPWRGGNRGALPASMQNAVAKTKGER
jgi:hypothetical protein